MKLAQKSWQNAAHLMTGGKAIDVYLDSELEVGGMFGRSFGRSVIKINENMDEEDTAYAFFHEVGHARDSREHSNQHAYSDLLEHSPQLCETQEELRAYEATPRERSADLFADDVCSLLRGMGIKGLEDMLEMGTAYVQSVDTVMAAMENLFTNPRYQALKERLKNG